MVAPTSVKGGRSIRKRARRRPLADHEVELEILHRRIEHFLDRRLQAVDLVDEQHIARLQIGQDGGQVAGLLNDRAGGCAETHAEFAGHDLGKGCLAEARWPVQQHMVQSFAAGTGRFDEDGEVLPAAFLADEVGQDLRAEACFGRILDRADGGDGALLYFLRGGRLVAAAVAGARGHRASSLSAAGMSAARSGSSPSRAVARLSAACASGRR